MTLSANQESFLQLMKKSDEHARKGFELLAARHDLDKFFDRLDELGLFDSEHNPVPVESEPGYFRIPYWGALIYLEATAKRAGETNDVELAGKVMRVVRKVSQAREPDRSVRDNYRTWFKFAEILGLVPTGAIVLEDIDLIPGWLQSKFDKGGMVGHALSKGAMSRLLASELRDDWIKACQMLLHCTGIRWIEKKDLGETEKKAVALIEDYWLKEFLHAHAKVLGEKVGKQASEILLSRLKEVMGEGKHGDLSRIWRPAIEDDEQNYSGHDPQARFIEGLRDVLLAWVDRDPQSALPFVEELIRAPVEIIRRIGIAILNAKFNALREALPGVLNTEFLDDGHIHETYELLKARFSSFNEEEKERVFNLIRGIPTATESSDPERRLRYNQRNWLSAIVGQGYSQADRWFEELSADPSLGSVSEHPSFHYYSETWSGPGPSPYQARDLLGFASKGELVERLNNFKQSDSWRGPTTHALVDTLEQAVKDDPGLFVDQMPGFVAAKRPFQYGLIKGFKSLWDSPAGADSKLDWGKTWEALFDLFEELIFDTEFWTEAVERDPNWTPTRDWIPKIIADFIDAGTRKDERAYPPSLLPRGQEILAVLLEKSEAVDEPHLADAMNQAINSSKGSAVEALLSHTLRLCRLEDQGQNGHANAWEKVAPLFDAQLAKCQNGNFEFSVLMGAYITNMHYIDKDWLEGNIERIFPQPYDANLQCALDGLSYSSASRPVYKLLVEHGVVDDALRRDLKSRHARERLLERIALAYLWGDETLTAPRFAYLFSVGREGDLQEISRFFWSVSNQKLTASQIESILSFWEHCINWAETQKDTPKGLLSSLSRLICYLEVISARELRLLMAVAPHVSVDHNSDMFIEQLEPLITSYSQAVGSILVKVLEDYNPGWDFEGRLLSLVKSLAKHGRRTDAIELSNHPHLRNLQGFQELYENIVSGTV